MNIERIVCHAMNDDEEYRDVNVYIVSGDGSEWCMRISLDKEKSSIIDCGTMYAEDEDDCFDETDMEPPEDVTDALRAIDGDVRRLIYDESEPWVGQEKVFRNDSGRWVEE